MIQLQDLEQTKPLTQADDEEDAEETPPEDDALSPAVWKRRKFCFLYDMLCCFLLFWLAESARGMVVSELPVVVANMKESSGWLGITIAIFSVGRLFSSTLFGFWAARRSSTEALIVSLLLACVGSVMYSFGSSSQWMLLASRLIQGLATGNFSVVRAYVANITSREQRTKFLAYGGAMQFIGFGLMSWVPAVMGSWKLNSSTVVSNTGLLLLVLNVGALIAVLFLHEKEIATSPVSKAQRKEDSVASAPIQSSILALAPLVCILLNFLARGILSIIETKGPWTCQSELGPIYDTDNDADLDCAVFFTVCGVIGLAVFIGIDFVPKRRVSEFTQLLIGFGCLCVGCLILATDIDAILVFGSGTILLWSLGSPITQTLTLSISSKLLDPHSQSVFMGLIGSAASLGRILFPLITGFTSSHVSFALGAILAAAILCTLYVSVRITGSLKLNQE